MKGIILLTTTVGSIIGAYAPNIWGDHNGFDAASILLGGVGAIIGIWAGWKLANEWEI